MSETQIKAKDSGLNGAVNTTVKRDLKDHGIILLMLGGALFILYGWIQDTRTTNKEQNKVIMDFALENQKVIGKATSVMERVERVLDRNERSRGPVAHAPVIEGND